MGRSRSIQDFSRTLISLLGSLTAAQKGDLEEITSIFPYVKQRLEVARVGLEKLGLLAEANQVIADAEAQCAQSNYELADQIVLSFARKLNELSGQNDRWRRMYGGHAPGPNVH